MADTIESLTKRRAELQHRIKIHQLKEEAMQKELDEITRDLQQLCLHTDIERTSSYHTGGYDYCAETIYTERCKVCEKALRTWSKMHHNIYG
jgi:hypothetical protein